MERMLVYISLLNLAQLFWIA